MKEKNEKNRDIQSRTREKKMKRINRFDDTLKPQLLTMFPANSSFFWARKHFSSADFRGHSVD